MLPLIILCVSFISNLPPLLNMKQHDSKNSFHSLLQTTVQLVKGETLTGIKDALVNGCVIIFHMSRLIEK